MYTHTKLNLFSWKTSHSVFFFSNSVKKKAKRMKTRSGKQQVSGIIQMDKWRMQSFYGPCTSDTLLFSTHIRRHVQSSIFSWNPYLSSLNSFRRHLISRCISWHMAKKVQNEESFFLLFKFTHSLFMEAYFFFLVLTSGLHEWATYLSLWSTYCKQSNRHWAHRQMFTAACHLEENTMNKIKGGVLLDGHSEKAWEGRIWTVNKAFKYLNRNLSPLFFKTDTLQNIFV